VRASTAPEARTAARAPHIGVARGAIGDSRNRPQNKASSSMPADDSRCDARASPRRAIEAAALAALRRLAFARRAKRRRRAR
jgi:hypothetical protein